MTVETIKSVKVDKIFAEGTDYFTDKDGKPVIYMLTYQDRHIYKYDTDFNLLDSTIPMPDEVREGWGMTHDPETPNIAIISDGSSTVFFCDTLDNFKVMRTIQIKNERGYDEQLINELEFVDGYLWANIFMTTQIVKIDPKTGLVIKRVDFKALFDFAKKYSKSILKRDMA